MRNKKLLLILIPVLAVVLVLIVGVIFIALNSSPEKIFEHSISKVFGMFESSEEQFSTMKGSMDLTASVESDDEEVQAVNDMLEGSSIGLDMQVDTKNMVINEAVNVTFNNESLLNASLLLQDQKGYVYLPDWLDKYLQIPEELDYSELTDASNKVATLEQEVLIEAVKEELIKAVSAQELVKEKTTLVLDGQETKVNASVLSLKNEEIEKFSKEFLSNLKANEKFQTSLGDYKDDINLALDESIQILDNNTSQDIEFDDEIRLVIYTKGFFNEFVGVSAKVIDGDTTGFELLKNSDEKYEFKAYNEYDGEREEAFNIKVENKKEGKNKGTATITMTVEEEQFIVTCNYKKQGKQTTFVASTEIEGVVVSISGNIVEDGKNVKGNIEVSVQEETFGKANINCAYDFTYDVEVQKTDTQNAVLINELSEEDQTTLMTNLKKLELNNWIVQGGVIDYAQPANQATQDAMDKENQFFLQAPTVTYGGHTVMYTVPEGFNTSEYSGESYKMYMDENFNSVNISIDYDTVDDYMGDLDDEYVLTSSFYKNQKISDTKTYVVNGKEYKFRTITYNDEYGSYAKLYFAYELDDKYCYVVEVESKGGISMEIIKKFLDVIVTKNSMQNEIDLESNLESEFANIDAGLQMNSLINKYTSDI